MTAGKNKSYKVDFYVITHNGDRDHNLVRDFLKPIKSNGYSDALSLSADSDEKYQIRNLVPLGHRSSYKGIFGRCRFGERPEQGTAQGDESDVELKPGHGLVEKNHFLFFSKRNLLVYQRNTSGSHYGRFQRYLSEAIGEPLLFEPLLTTDSYKRLIDGAGVRSVDISFQQPKDPTLYEDLWFSDAIKLVKKAGGLNARVRISVGRTNTRLIEQMKEAALKLAKGGLARVARVKLEDESEAIDLIADRIVENITVKLNTKGRPESEDIYARLQQAEAKRARDLKSFYGN